MRLAGAVVVGVVAISVLVADSSSALARRRCARRNRHNSPKPVARVDTNADPILFLPDYVEVIANIPSKYVLEDHVYDESAPANGVAQLITGHAIGNLYRPDPENYFAQDDGDRPEAAERGDESLVETVEPFIGDVSRVIVACWERDEHSPPQVRGIANWNGWNGVVLYVFTEKGASAELRRAVGPSHRMEGYRHVVIIEAKVDGMTSPVKYLGFISDRMLVVGTSAKAVEEIVMAAHTPNSRKRANPWDEYLSSKQRVGFWAARKAGGGIGHMHGHVGFAAVPSSDAKSFYLTYLFGEGKVPEQYRVGTAINEEDRPPLWITRYNAEVTVKEVTSSKIVCEVPLDQYRGGAAAFVTILMNLGTIAFRPGDKSP